MNHWAFDIDRQSGWDLWCWVCIAASLAMVLHWVVGRLVHQKSGFLSSILCWGAFAITAAVLTLPFLRNAIVGLIWTTVLLLTLSVLQYLELRARLTRPRVALLLVLRSIALLLAVPMLFEPVLRFTSQKTPDRPLVLLVDASGSMSVPDMQNGPTRMQSIGQALAGQWRPITDRFKPTIIPFSGQSQQTASKPQDVVALNPDGQASDLVGAVAKALQQVQRDDAEIVLLSDGLDNTSADVVGAMRASRRPIHTVLVGSDQSQPAAVVNVAIDRVDPGEEWTVRSAAKVKVNVRSSSLAGRIVDVNLAEVDEQNRPVGTPITSRLVLQPSPGGQEVSFDFTPKRTGVHRMSTWIEPIAGERSTADNRRTFQQLATDARIKVLYVEGRARPEYTQLARALGRDGNVESATLLRVTADKFAASGAIDGQPVKQLPVTAEQWRKFDVIILGDVDSSFLSPQQMQAIEQAVTEGAGLLMLGGQNSFGPGGYAGTPIEKALPVQAGKRDAAQEKSEFIPQIVPGSETHPVLEGLGEWFTEKNEKGLQTLLGNVVVGAPKAGAQVLLEHRDRPAEGGKPQIILAVQRYGKGRSAAFTADTTYRWYLPMRGLGQQSPYTIFWGQLVRWLAGTDVKNRGLKAGVETLVDKTVLSLGEPVRVRAMVRDQKGDATRFAQVSMQLTHKSGKPDENKTLSLTPVAMRDGMYELTIPNLAQGEWAAEVIASKDKAELGRQKIDFSVIPPADEMLKLAADAALMQRIAAETGGFAYTLPQLPQLIDLLSRKGGDQALIEQRSVPLHSAPRSLLAMVGVYPKWAQRFDLPTQTLLVVVLLTAEWVLRRRWQLL